MGLERLPRRGHARTMQGSKGCLVCATGLNPSWASNRVHQEHFGNTGPPLGAATDQDDTCTCCSDLQQKNNENSGFILHVLENVRPFIPRLLGFFVVVFLSGDKFAYTNSTLCARISPQWFNELRRLWPNVP